MTATAPRTIRIPDAELPQALVEASRRRHGDAYTCVICGLAMPKPKFMCHVIEGGGVALHVEDEALYVSDGGDMNFLPIGSDCLKKHPEMKPYSVKA